MKRKHTKPKVLDTFKKENNRSLLLRISLRQIVGGDSGDSYNLINI